MADEKIIFSMVGVSKVLNNNKKILNNIYLSFFYALHHSRHPHQL